MKGLDRRSFLRRAGVAGALGSAAVLKGRDVVRAQHAQLTHSMHHGGHGAVGTVDHARNGFDPHDILTDFDGGEVSKDRSGRTVREYEFIALAKEIEVAPGIFFPA